MSSNMAALHGEAHFFEESMNPAKVKDYLSRPREADKLKGMKWLLAMMSKGKDVSEFFSDVVKSVVARSVEVKKMVYIYLVHYADANPQCRELALLSINSFQKDLAAPNQLIRALALRVMTSIRVPDIIQIQLLAVRKCASDSSAYVRKCAANAIPKIYALDTDQGPSLCQILEKLLKDSSTMVLGSTVAAFNEVCPNNYELLHGEYRKLCHLLADVDEWGQIVIISVLMRYIRTQFRDPSPKASKPKPKPPAAGVKPSVKKVKRRVVKKAFYSDEEDESTEEEVEVHANVTPEVGSVFTASDQDLGADLDPDHRLLLKCALPLLKSRNSGVVLSVCLLHYYCGVAHGSTGAQLAKAMVRILRNRREIQYVVLDAIRAMALERAYMFRPFLQEFYVKASDPPFSCSLKLDILTCLANKDNVGSILRELQTYVRHSDKGFVCAAVRAVGRVADQQPEVAEQCLQGLFSLVNCSKTDTVVGEAVVVIRQLLQQNPDYEGAGEVVRRLVRLLLRSYLGPDSGYAPPPPPPKDRKDGSPAAPPPVPVDLTQPDARASVIWVAGEYSQHIHALAPDLLRILADQFPDSPPEVKCQVVNYGVKLALQRPHEEAVQSLAAYVLEMARFDTSLDVRDRARFMTAMLGLAASDDAVDEAALVALRAKADDVMLHAKLPPLTSLGSLLGLEGMPHLLVGSLSAMMGCTINGYQDLPPWTTQPPDPSVRDAPATEEALKAAGISEQHPSAGAASRPRATSEDSQGSEFYTDSQAGSESGSYSTSSSDESQGSETGSDYGSVSSRSRSASEGSFSATGSEAESGSSYGSYSGSDSESSVAGEEGVGLLNMGGTGTGAGIGTLPKNTYGASLAPPQSADLTGLVQSLAATSLEPGRLSPSPQPMAQGAFAGVGTQPKMSSMGSGRNFAINPMGGAMARGAALTSLPKTLLRHEVGGGLQIDYAFTRGFPTNVDPAQRSPTVLRLLLTLTNKRDLPIRRIHALPPRDGTAMFPFPEVTLLAPGESVQVPLALDFGGRSREVRLEVKTDKGSHMVSLTPGTEELVRPCVMTAEEFESGCRQLQGLCQGQADFRLVDPASEAPMVPSRVLQAVNVLELQGGPSYQETGVCCFAGSSTSGTQDERVLVRVTVNSGTGQGSIHVHTDNAMVQPVVLAAVKKLVVLDNN